MYKSWSIVILCAGHSKRTTTVKQLWNVKNKPLILWQIEHLSKIYPDNIYCITGANREKIESLLSNKQVRIIFNPKYEKGMFTSIKIALSEVKEEKTLFLPVDTPTPDADVYFSLLKYDLAVPTYKGKGGHPVLIARKYFSEILKEANRLDTWLKKQKDLVRLEVKDKNILLNLNTDKEIELWVKSLNNRNINRK